MKKRIDLILVEKKLAYSRSKAQAMIMAGQVLADGKKIKKSGESINLDSDIKILNLNSEWVSRGAIKILHALNYFNLDIKDLICLDIGASTGGFSQVLLMKKAKKIYSVDVGRNQLHEKLKKNKKIINLEKTNARYLDNTIIKDTIDLIVCDVSFISLKKVLEPAFKLLNSKTGKFIGLIKPQFEALKKEVKNGGVIKDPLVHERICDEIQKWLIKYSRMEIVGTIESPIKGPKGNKEFLIFAKYN